MKTKSMMETEVELASVRSAIAQAKQSGQYGQSTAYGFKQHCHKKVAHFVTLLAAYDENLNPDPLVTEAVRRNNVQECRESARLWRELEEEIEVPDTGEPFIA